MSKLWKDFFIDCAFCGLAGVLPLMPVMPAEIICQQCGRTLYAHRLTSRVTPKSGMMPYIEYNKESRE
ncbi:hypothetical protein LCGC14_0873310 [marine sediment metagenome]|uniref:Uncharacterized protein n=1 Tax=marine sediment metagenome TaxID=412755 RepID=A0A0F9SB09_9ZZZZ